jgi:hypothetical protein
VGCYEDNTPTITTSASLSTFSACSGTNSSEQSFTISGSNLTNNIVISPPTGYEISESSGTGFTSSITLTQSGGSVGSTTIYVRTTTSASNGNGGNIECTSTGATQVDIATGSASISLGTIYVNDNSTAGDIYASAAFDGSGDGTIGDPVNTLTAALALATCPTGATIYIDAGTYTDDLINWPEVDNISAIGAGIGVTIFQQSGTGDRFATIDGTASGTTITDMTISTYDEAGNGGAFNITTSGTVTFEDIHFDACGVTSTTDGGAVYNSSSSTVTIKRSKFTNNYSANNNSSNGSCVYTEGNLTLENCLFYDNTCLYGTNDAYAGQVFCRTETHGTTTSITNCTFTENNAGTPLVYYDGDASKQNKSK